MSAPVQHERDEDEEEDERENARMSHDSSAYELPVREKHDSLPFVLDPIDLSLDPLRFSFLGGLDSTFDSLKTEDSLGGLDISFDSVFDSAGTSSKKEETKIPEVPREPEKTEEASQELDSSTDSLLDQYTTSQSISEETGTAAEEKEDSKPATLKPEVLGPASPSKPAFSFDGTLLRADAFDHYVASTPLLVSVNKTQNKEDSTDTPRPTLVSLNAAKDQEEKQVTVTQPESLSPKKAQGEAEEPNTTPKADSKDGTMKSINVPKHPIASMQEAFAESMHEASGKSTPVVKKSNMEDAIERRVQLLDQEVSAPTYASKWKQKPGQQYHELWKLVAQISFGSYLLFDGIAKNDEDVLNILQGHVDEVDEFLESTLQDFDHAKQDIDERLRCLKIPMENVDIFDQMLTDRVFRTSIVDGNEQIEHVITRTAAAMNDALKDVQQGLSATKDFAVWLSEVQRNPAWAQDRPDMQRVYDAMKGNAEGWYKAFVSLQTKGNHLGIALVQLGSIVAEMDRRAGEVSRKMRFSTDPRSSPTVPVSPPQSPESSQSFSGPRQSIISQNSNKTLPNANMITPAIKATIPAFQYVGDRERTPEPEKDSDSETDSDEEPEIMFTKFDIESDPEPVPEPEPIITLQPRVYTPAALSPTKLTKTPPLSQQPSPTTAEPAPPIIGEKSSLRQRFSFKKKQPSSNPAPAYTPMAAPSMGPPPPPISTTSPRGQQSPPMMPAARHQSHTSSSPRQSPLQSNSPRQVSVSSARQQLDASSPRQSSLSSPHFPSTSSQRVQSAGYQQQQHLESPGYRQNTLSQLGDPNYRPALNDPQLIPSQLPTPAGSQSLNDSYFPTPPVISSPFLSSPRSDQQHFRPVRADPNNALQRPWTAAPESHMQRNLRHSHSNNGMQNQYQQRASQNSSNNFQRRDPSTLSANRAGAGQSQLHRTTMAPSITSDSGASGYTVGFGEDGKKIKKKKSGFGWLKKAFSLSEEERMAFEERRRQTERGYGVYNNVPGDGRARDAPRFLDGKRIR